MLDRREDARDKVFYGGIAEIGERGATRDCIVRNISEKGAHLEFGNVINLPKEKLSLVVARKGRSFLARVIWWRDKFVGVAFNPEEIVRTAGLRSRGAAAQKRTEKAPATTPHQGADRRALRGTPRPFGPKVPLGKSGSSMARHENACPFCAAQR